MADFKSHSSESKLHNEDELKFKQRYALGKTIGRGAFAVVKQGVDIGTGELYAVKVIKKSKLTPEELTNVRSEISILLKVDHPNCVKLYEVFETKKKFYLVMEMLTGGELFHAIVRKGCLSEKDAARIVKDIVHALQSVHAMGITHRDLKPENLLFQHKGINMPIKITDFGLAALKPACDEMMSTTCGTPGYVAPEILRQEKYTQAVDLWSVGVILYILLCGFPPFYHERQNILFRQIKSANYDFPACYWDHISQDAKDLVRGLICLDVSKRLTCDQVLAHPWMQSFEKADAPEKELPSQHIRLLQLTIAKCQLRRAVQAVIACNRMISLIP